ncbi:ATP-binding protein [Polyangium aurulentum]|uniref:ATP-binding protein n=1 Tax=Polyangium aurulentum TaxID=2567896 RepID=UPI0010AEBDC9|nr:tetratricopeptide repeat protein [Polyangium aurulentum]UQA55411.1 AAA family ATPase [Polyangium aurulentum]
MSQGEATGDRLEIDTERTLLGKPTPCVGRERELSVLRGLLEECLGKLTARAALITGPVGAGKSRVWREFLGGALRDGSRAEVWIARGDPLGAGSPLGIVSQLVRRAAGLREGEPLATRRDKLRARAERSVGGARAAAILPFLGELAGAPFSDEDDVHLAAARRDPALMGERMASAWDDFLGAASAKVPVILVLEDMHWGDRPSVRLLDGSLRTLRDRPLFVLATARPDVHDRFPRLWHERQCQELRLGELPRKASERLVRFMLGDDADPEIVSRIVSQASGNAFYLEELIRAVAEGNRDELPSTAIATVHARLETLQPDARRVLQMASVFGEVFWRGGVAALLEGALADGALEPALSALCTREFVSLQRQSALAGEEQYAFRNALVREAAYATLTPEAAGPAHRKAGAWLEGAGERDAMVLAEHLKRGEERARAAVFYVRAAEQALEANDLAGVISRIERAVACGAEGALLGLARRLEAEARVWRGELGQAIDAGRQAMALLPQKAPGWFSAMSDVATAAWRRGNHDRLVYLANQLDKDWDDPAAIAPRAAATARLALFLLRAGLTQDAARLFRRLDALGEEVKADGIVSARLHEAIGWRALVEGDPSASSSCFAKAAATFEQLGDLREACNCRVNAAMARMHLGGYTEARKDLGEALSFANRFGLYNVRARIQHNLGNVLAHLGELEGARKVEEEALAAFVTQGDYWHEVAARIYLVHILLGLGRVEEAEQQVSRAVDLSLGVQPLRCSAALARARVLLVQGNGREAHLAALGAMYSMQKLGSIEEDEPLLRLTFAEASWAAGLSSMARVAIGTARQRLLDRAAQIKDPAWRRSFLENVPENARTIELARAWLDETAKPAGGGVAEGKDGK